jgi:Tfp pilus assembly ATPase PilU
MAHTNLSEVDAKLYRLYAVGALSYEDALEMAQSVFHLRRAMLEFDQNACVRSVPSARRVATT